MEIENRTFSIHQQRGEEAAKDGRQEVEDEGNNIERVGFAQQREQNQIFVSFN